MMDRINATFLVLFLELKIILNFLLKSSIIINLMVHLSLNRPHNLVSFLVYLPNSFKEPILVSKSSLGDGHLLKELHKIWERVGISKEIPQIKEIEYKHFYVLSR